MAGFWRFLGLLGEFCLGLAVGGVLLGELFRALALSGRPLSRRDDATWPHAATMPVCCPPNRPGSYRTTLQPPQLADDWPFFRHTDDTGALAQGERRSHRHGAGTASEHEENQHVLGADGKIGVMPVDRPTVANAEAVSNRMMSRE